MFTLKMVVCMGAGISQMMSSAQFLLDMMGGIQGKEFKSSYFSWAESPAFWQTPGGLPYFFY